MLHKNIFRWIFSCQAKEFSDLGKDKESFNYRKEHGQCGQTDNKLHMMMEPEVYKLMEYIHLLLFNANQNLSSLVYFSEIQMPNHQFSHIIMIMSQVL
jgi:hypothetical protein